MQSSESTQDVTPLVSIITPSFNQAHYLDEIINSVFEQEYKNIEFIIVDGGSTDGSVEILKKYGDKLRWVSESDNGQSEAINKGLRMAKGEILAWLCGVDDLYKPYTVKTVVDFFQKNLSTSMVHGPGEYIDPDGNVIMSRKGGDFSLEQLICVNTIMDPTVFFRREVLEKVGDFNEDLHYVMAWDYWVRTALAGLQIKYIPGKVLAQAREHNDSKTIKYKERFWNERFMVFEKIFNSPDIPVPIKKIRNRAYSGVYASSAFFYFRYGDFGKSFSALRKSFVLWPGVLFMFNPVVVVSNVLQAIRSNIYLKRKNSGISRVK